MLQRGEIRLDEPSQSHQFRCRESWCALGWMSGVEHVSSFLDKPRRSWQGSSRFRFLSPDHLRLVWRGSRSEDLRQTR